MMRSERQRKAMFAQMQGKIRSEYRGLPQRTRYQLAGASMAAAGLGALKIAKGPVGKFAVQVGKIGLIAKAVTLPGKVVKFGMKAHKISWTRRALKTATADPNIGLYVSRKGHILNPEHVAIAMKPFSQRMRAIMSQAI